MRRIYLSMALESKAKFDTAMLDEGWKDTLIALIENGPLFDGDLPSKTGRDTLIDNEFAVRVVVKGEDGFNAATHKGAELYKQLTGKDNLKDAIEQRKSWD